jgi:putative tricarboxylic transport membrane protein
MYGGAIPAILINTPGTPVNALTTYDGYAMTQRGEAGRGLSLAYSASFFGGSFSILVALSALVLFGPYLRDLGALFGQRDIFMAALLGAGAADPGASPDNGHCRATVWCRFHDFTDRAAITETH